MYFTYVSVTFNCIAAQMWLFSRILPMLVGDHVSDDDEDWQNFLILMEIVDHLFYPQVTLICNILIPEPPQECHA